MADDYLGCSDHGCVFGHPGGMGTNGGCNCLDGVRSPIDRVHIRTGIQQLRDKVKRLENQLILTQAGANAAGAQMLDVQQDCIAANKKVRKLEEQLRRSASVCPKEGCMLWRDHEQKHATKEQVEEALAANSHPKRKR